MFRFRVTELFRGGANEAPAFPRKAGKFLNHEIERAVSCKLGAQAEIVCRTGCDDSEWKALLGELSDISSSRTPLRRTTPRIALADLTTSRPQPQLRATAPQPRGS